MAIRGEFSSRIGFILAAAGSPPSSSIPYPTPTPTPTPTPKP